MSALDADALGQMHEVQRCPHFGRYQEKSGRRPDIAVSVAFDQGGRRSGYCGAPRYSLDLMLVIQAQGKHSRDITIPDRFIGVHDVDSSPLTPGICGNVVRTTGVSSCLL